MIKNYPLMIKDSTIPTPMEMDELEALLIEYGILDDDTKHAEIIGKPAEATK